jgi:hypothetical protein
MIKDWESILYKNVISKDDQLIGRVTATSKESITVAYHREDRIECTYMIPKSRVKGYHNGSELLLNLHFIIVDRFKV